MKNLKKTIPSAILFIVLAFALISFYVVKNKVYKVFDNPFNIQQDRLDVCREDSDCIMVDYDGCCGKQIPINKKYSRQYKEEPFWQKHLQDCSEINCPWFVTGNELKCRVVEDGMKRCTTQIDVSKVVDVEKCMEKFDFISNSKDCKEDCTDKGVYAFYIGGNEKLEGIMEKSNYKLNGYEDVFPKNIEKKVIAAYDTRECESCDQKFVIREGIGLNEVDIYRFCHYLEKQNNICKDCTQVEKIVKE